MGKPQKKPRSKEEILAELKADSKFQANMSFVKEKFYPALIKATTSVNDATENLSIINTIVMEKFLGKMKELKLKDLDLYTNLSTADPKYEELKAMLELFDDLSVFDAKELMEGLKSEIELFKSEVFKEMKLEDLKTRWLDEI